MLRVLCFALISVLVVQTAIGQLDFSSVLGNQRFVQNQLKCLQDTAPCDRTGRMIKKALPEILQRNCANCTPQQKATAQRLVSYAKSNFPREWNSITAKYKG